MLKGNKNIFSRWIQSFFDLRKLLSILFVPAYLIEYLRYKRISNSKETVRFFDTYPCLADRTRTTPFDPHYFYQGHWLASRLADVKPLKHVDIGSDVRVIGVLSCFIDTLFIDYRPLNVDLPRLECGQGNLLELSLPTDSIQSLSCLHVIEHVGLGRYGDRIDPDGSKKACKELQRVVAPGGSLYLSAPVGVQKVYFNAHRVHTPLGLIHYFNHMELVSFSVVDDNGAYHDNASVLGWDDLTYGCGMFHFKKRG